MGEGDSVQLGPGREDPLLRDEAVVVALAAVLVLDVGDTLVRPLGLIVVVGRALQAGPLAGAEQTGAVRQGRHRQSPYPFQPLALLWDWGGGGVSLPSLGLSFPICKMDVGWTRLTTVQLFFFNTIKTFSFP